MELALEEAMHWSICFWIAVSESVVLMGRVDWHASYTLEMGVMMVMYSG